MSMQRAYSLSGAAMKREGADGPLVVEMAFASDRPYERWWGIEVLDMAEKSVRLGRLNDGDGGSVLFNHNWNDLRGRHEPGSVRVEKDGFLRGRVIVSPDTQVMRDTIAQIESKTLSKASVGYTIHTVVEQTTAKSGEKIEREIDGATFSRLIDSHSQKRDGRVIGGDAAAFRRALDSEVGAFERGSDDPPVYRVVDWEPLENSFVTVPADNGVGVGRAAESRAAQTTITVLGEPTKATLNAITTAVRKAIDNPVLPAAPQHERKTMTVETQAAAGASAEATQTETRLAAQPRQGPNAMQMELARKSAITNMSKASAIDDNIRDHWIGSGMSAEQVAEELLQIVEQRGKTDAKPATALGLNEGEAQRFSIFRAIRAVADKNWSSAGFEAECSREIAKRLNKITDPNKFYVPFEVQKRGQPMRRDLTVGTASAGGYLVGTDNVSFIELMRNRSVVYRMGARQLSGLVGSVTVPKQSGAATAVWLANEASTATESAQTFGQMALTPKTVGAYTEISRQLLLQSSPDAEGIVRSDLATVCALAIDVGALRGSGASGEPQGIVGTAGVGSVTGASLAAAGVLEFQSDVAGGNLLSESCGYVTTPAVAALLMARPELPSTGTTRLWVGNMLEGTLFNMRAMSSNQMTAATMLFGDFSQVIVGEWGVLEVEVNPYANFQAGIVGVRAMVSIDVGVRYGGAFSYASSIT